MTCQSYIFGLNSTLLYSSNGNIPGSVPQLCGTNSGQHSKIILKKICNKILMQFRKPHFKWSISSEHLRHLLTFKFTLNLGGRLTQPPSTLTSEQPSIKSGLGR